MINGPRWATSDGKTSHLLTDSYYVNQRRDEERETWCGQRLSSQSLTESDTVRRCGGCLRKLEAYSKAALAAIPDRVRETVTVTVERPLSKRVGAQEQGEDSAQDLVAMALGRRKTWEIVGIETVSVIAVDVTPTQPLPDKVQPS